MPSTFKLGILWLLLGDHEQAQLCLREGYKIFTGQGAKGYKAECFILLSLLFEQLKDRPAVPTVSRLLSATAAPCAADVLSQAWGLVQKQAAQISESRLRDLFLTNIPCHCELAQGVASIQRPLSVT